MLEKTPAFLPSHEGGGRFLKPRLRVLEVRHREHPDQEPIAHVFVERCEQTWSQPKDEPPYQAAIELHYRAVWADGRPFAHRLQKFGAGFSRRDNTLALTSWNAAHKGAVFLDLEGLEGNRVGTWLMNELVEWAKTSYPGAEIRRITLEPGMGTPDNKVRRNEFYEQFGIRFAYDDAEHRGGHSLPVLAAELNTVEKWTLNIKEIDLLDFEARRSRRLHDAEWASSQSKRDIDDFSKERLDAMRHPFRAYCKTMIGIYPAQVAITAVAVLAVLTWLIAGRG